MATAIIAHVHTCIHMYTVNVIHMYLELLELVLADTSFIRGRHTVTRSRGCVIHLCIVISNNPFIFLEGGGVAREGEWLMEGEWLSNQ